MYDSTIICSIDRSRVIIRAYFLAGSPRVLRPLQYELMLMYNSTAT
jgi:hypothetical protein